MRTPLVLLLACLSVCVPATALAQDPAPLQSRHARDASGLVGPVVHTVEQARDAAGRGGSKPPIIERTYRLRPPPRRVPFGDIFGGAVLGEVGGALVGALVGVLVAALAGCHEGQGWVQWRTCAAGYGYAATVGAMLGAPVGTGIGTVFALERWGVSPDPETAIGGATLGWLPAGLVGVVMNAAFAPDLTLGLLVPGVLGAVISPLLSTAFSHAEVVLPLRFAPVARPIPGGAELGLAGSF
ncbi:MAG: hypothetical protein EVA89_35295 [Sandaracinaceae bacterium]|nr:MAG: hypothetical protein EVA89_35295 [Sandaracinaceae bacterium]